jgi:hypothetical protein
MDPDEQFTRNERDGGGIGGQVLATFVFGLTSYIHYLRWLCTNSLITD